MIPGDERPYEPLHMDTRAWLAIPPQALSLVGLRLSQDHLRLSSLLRPGPSHCGDEYPHAVVWRGEAWLVDGHHRVTRAWLLGAREVQARILAEPRSPAG